MVDDEWSSPYVYALSVFKKLELPNSVKDTMQTIYFENQDCRLFCPVTGIPFNVETGMIDSPALAFLKNDEVDEFCHLNKELEDLWSQSKTENTDDDDEFDSDETLEQFLKKVPDNIVCFNMSDGISGGYLRVAFDMDYEPDDQ